MRHVAPKEFTQNERGVLYFGVGTYCIYPNPSDSKSDLLHPALGNISHFRLVNWRSSSDAGRVFNDSSIIGSGISMGDIPGMVIRCDTDVDD